MSASDNLSTKCSGVLLRSSFAILAARTRHRYSTLSQPRPSRSPPGWSNSSDIVHSPRLLGLPWSRCSRMSVPSVQNQTLRLVDRFGRRSRRSQIAAYPRQDRQDGHRHPEDKHEPSWFQFWFRCHGTPSWRHTLPGTSTRPSTSCRTLEERTGGDV